jgi:uncharacterized protein YegP (UPF0339 family)
MAGKFKIRTNERGEFWFELKAGNGEVIAESEPFASKAGALNCIASVRRYAANASVVDENGELIGEHA